MYVSLTLNQTSPSIFRSDCVRRILGQLLLGPIFGEIMQTRDARSILVAPSMQRPWMSIQSV